MTDRDSNARLRAYSAQLEARVGHVSQLNIVLTNKCNLGCLPCAYPRQRPFRFLRRATIGRILLPLLDVGLKRVMLTGGEPCLHPDLDVIVDDLFRSGLDVTLVTNGTLLRSKLPTLAGKLKRIIISLDADTADRYEAIRGSRAFGRLVDLPSQINAYSPDTHVTLCLLIQCQNFRRLPEFVKFAASVGADRVSFLVPDIVGMTAPRDRGGAFGHARELKDDLLDRILLSLDDIKELRSEVIPKVRVAMSQNPSLECPQMSLLDEFAAYFEAYRQGVSRGDTRRCSLPFHELVLDERERIRLCFFMPDCWPLDESPDPVNAPGIVAARVDYLESDFRVRRYCDMCLQAARVQVSK